MATAMSGKPLCRRAPWPMASSARIAHDSSRESSRPEAEHGSSTQQLWLAHACMSAVFGSSFVVWLLRMGLVVPKGMTWRSLSNLQASHVRLVLHCLAPLHGATDAEGDDVEGDPLARRRMPQGWGANTMIMGPEGVKTDEIGRMGSEGTRIRRGEGNKLRGCLEPGLD